VLFCTHQFLLPDVDRLPVDPKIPDALGLTVFIIKADDLQPLFGNIIGGELTQARQHT